MKKYWLETYGCQMNIAESNALELQLRGAGLIPASRADEADCAILNTCTVRKSADNRIWGRLGEFSRIKRSHPLTLIVTGCMAERLQEDLKDDAPQVDYVIGTNDKQRIVNILTSADGKLDEVSASYAFTESYHQEGEFSSYIPIMNGCNNFCSYCIVPYVRGREVSRPVDDILAELAFLDSKGVKEVTLLGQNVNSYHYVESDGTVVTFPELLKRICRQENSIKWIRFDSPHPKDFSHALIKVIRNEEKVAKHLHIPMQSGSSRILSLMNRRYDRARFISLINEIKSEIPSVTFATDVMVGFPTETEEEYEETLSLLDHMGCIEAFMYYFNPREGTRAETMAGQVPEAERGRRLTHLIDFQHAIFAREKEKRLGEVVEVVVTQVSKHDEAEMLGRSEHNEMIAFACNLPLGATALVRLTALKGNTYTASMVQ